ncbi:hypothetical protein H1D24_11455 [Streptomyces sp. PSKA28]|uniref:Transposase n=1 Tax=Streptomyces himalayensis subsp. himalayensis TaxID=2756131 RepID=A0A7W0DJT6_9ACTN|nr:hypothetical protein [Streptomyces himalayensis subsp. himalayensis]
MPPCSAGARDQLEESGADQASADIRSERRGLTRPDAKAIPVPDLIGRDFTASTPGTKLVGDITLATVIDLATREVVGGTAWPTITALISSPTR